MNISKPFILRPVMTTLVMISIFTFGVIAFKKLPVSDLPNVDYPTIQVQVSYPGANPDTMANNCAVPLEREFMTIDGLQSIASTSNTGSTQLILQFALDKSLDSASIDVQSAINRAEPNLPNDLPYNPTYQKVNPSATPILYLALTSDSMTQADLYDYGNTYVGQRLNMIEGVSQVLTYGSPYAARIQIDPEKIAAKNIGIDDVALAIRQGNVDIPTGTLFGKKNEFTVDVDGQLMKADGYNNLSIKTKDGSIVKISEIGRALDSLQNDKYYLHYVTKTEDKASCIIAIQRQPGENTVEIINRINAEFPIIKKNLPASLEFHSLYDQSIPIMESIKDVEVTLLVAFILVVAVIYLSLGKIFDTITPALSLPMAIVGTFVIMYLLNYSIDILSLMALTLSIGFLVDDAIVVLENNVRHVQMGKKPLIAAIEGSKEIGITIVSMTMCLSSVFIPMLFLGGVVGRLFTEFAMTIIIAVIISGFISLTLTPLLCSRFVPPRDAKRKKSFMERFADKINDKMLNGYEKALLVAMKHKMIILSAGILSIFASIYLFIALPKDFLPNDDVGFIQGFTLAKDGTSPFEMAKYQKEVTSVIVKDPAVESVVSVASTSDDNEGVMFIKLKPFKQRDGEPVIISRLMKELYMIPGISSFLSEIPLINLQVGTQSRALYQYALTSIDQDSLNKATDALEKKMKGLSTITQVSSDLEIKQPQLFLSIDRDRASSLNVSAYKIENLLSNAYSGGKISTINAPINQYDVIIETLPSYYRSPETLSKLFVKSDTNKLVPLSEIVSQTEDVGPLSVNHLNGIPSATLSFNLLNTPLGTAVAQIESIAEETLPSNVNGKVLGTTDVFKTAFSDLTFLFLITFFVIYIILGILYENFIHPLTVMSALPPATFGGLFTLFVFGQTLSLYSFVGLIMLLGIVMKNGIMMVDFANKIVKEEKKSAYDAIFKACLIRFRPIMMTSIAAFFGALPIAIGIGGSSAKTRIPLGLVVVGGLIISQILTLFLTPIIYYYFEILQEKIRNKFRKKWDITVWDENL